MLIAFGGKKEGWHRLMILALVIVEIVMASLLRTLLVIREDQSSETHLLGLTGLFYLVVRIFDEALLPMHLVCSLLSRRFISVDDMV